MIYCTSHHLPSFGILRRTKLAASAMSELTEALRELNGLMAALGKSDEASPQKTILSEVLGMEVIVNAG